MDLGKITVEDAQRLLLFLDIHLYRFVSSKIRHTNQIIPARKIYLISFSSWVMQHARQDI